MSQLVTAHAYQYVVLRCVPRIEREEFLNVGVVGYCHATDWLASAWHLDPGRLAAFSSPGGPGALDPEQVRRSLRFVDAVCTADPDAGAVAHAPVSQRFGFLKAPRSTVVQPGPVHGGLARDLPAELDRLLTRLVR